MFHLSETPCCDVIFQLQLRFLPSPIIISDNMSTPCDPNPGDVIIQDPLSSFVILIKDLPNDVTLNSLTEVFEEVSNHPPITSCNKGIILIFDY